MLLSTPSPFSHTYSTPSRSCSSYYSARSHQPANSSPLASPSFSSPTHAVQERRRAQYKTTAFRSHTSHRTPDPTNPAKLLFRSGSQTSEDPKKEFLRERLQARCREHAQKLRNKAVNSRRNSDRYSDEFMDCEDEEETDDVIMQDELFRRIVQSANHRKKHSYRVSYALEVGSSFDPELDDVSVWESELQDQKSSSTEPTPDELEEEELMAYAEEYAALADFEDLDIAVDDLSASSDLEGVPLECPQQSLQRKGNQSSDMDIS